MDTAMSNRNDFLKTLVTWLIIPSFLLLPIYQLLTRAKLGLPIECLFMAQVFIVLFVSPYLAARAIRSGFLSTGATSTSSLLTLSSFPSGGWLLRLLVLSQVPLLCWAFLSTGVALFVMDVPFVKALQVFVILGIYSLSAGAVGMCSAQVFRDAFFGAEFAIFLWCVLIGGVFLLNPLERYVDNLQPFIAPVLHLNPLIVVCGIFEGMDIFRKPVLYELTPVTSYDYRYPNPWYLMGVWQLGIGGCCFLGAWRMFGSRGSIA
jgi:hypothetical protein